jgi:hypothetical protein
MKKPIFPKLAFNLGQKVYGYELAYPADYIKCPACDGTQILIATGADSKKYEVSCRLCYSGKIVVELPPTFEIFDEVVTSIALRLSLSRLGDTGITYWCEGGTGYQAHELFATKAAATAAAKRVIKT